MRLRVEFTTEPFDLEEAPEHALVARRVIGDAPLDAVDVGPFGNTAEGAAPAVLDAVGALLKETLASGATRVSLQISVLDPRQTPPDPAAWAGPGEDEGTRERKGGR